MSVIMQLNPFDFFTDLKGDALDEGYIWIGQPNKNPQSFPVTVYLDAALTIPAAQPLRTNAGHIVRGNSPTFLYISGNYSVLVQDKKRRQVFYVADFLLSGAGQAVSLADLSNSTDPAKGSGLVGFIQAGIGAVGRTALSKMRDFVSVLDFGAVGDGVSDDTAALTAAIAATCLAGQALYFPDGKTFNVSNITDTSNNNVHWFGRGKVHLTNDGGAITLSSVPTSSSLTADVARRATEITIQDGSIVKAGSLLFVFNSVPASNTYTMGPRQVFTVAANITNTSQPVVNGNVVGVLEPSEFSYRTTDAGMSVVVYISPRNVIIEGVQFYRDSNTTNRAVSLAGCTFDVRDVNFYNTVAPNPDNGQDGLQISRCANSKITNFRGDNLRYAIQVIDGSSNIEVSDAYITRSRHGVYPNDWANKLKVFNLRGENNNALLDSHASLNMYVDGVFTSSDRGFSNARGDGTTLRNVNITSTAETAGDGFRAAVIDWNASQADQKNTRDLTIENVIIVYPAAFAVSVNAVRLLYARNVVVNNFLTFPRLPLYCGSGSIGDVSEIQMQNASFDLAPTGLSIVRSPMYSLGRNNRLNNIPAVTSDSITYQLIPYPDGIINGQDIHVEGNVFRDTVSVAPRAFTLQVFPHSRPFNYFGVNSMQGVIKLRFVSSSFTITDYTLPFKYTFTGGSAGISLGSFTNVALAGSLISVSLGTVTFNNVDRIWSFSLPLSITRQAAGQTFTVSYEIDAIGTLL